LTSKRMRIFWSKLLTYPINTKVKILSVTDKALDDRKDRLLGKIGIIKEVSESHLKHGILFFRFSAIDVERNVISYLVEFPDGNALWFLFEDLEAIE